MNQGLRHAVRVCVRHAHTDDAGATVVVQQPVGQHVGGMAGAGGDQVGEGGSHPRLVLRPGDGHQPHSLRIPVRDRGALHPVPLLARLRPPLRVPQHPLLGVRGRLDHRVPGLAQAHPGHPAGPVHVDVVRPGAHLGIGGDAPGLDTGCEVEHLARPRWPVGGVEDPDPGLHDAAWAEQGGHPLDVVAHPPALVGDEGHEPSAGGQHVGERGELGVVGLPARHRPLVAVLVVAEGCRHPGRAGGESLVQQRRDAGSLVLARRPVPCLIAEDVLAQHAVPDQIGHVESEAAAGLGGAQVVLVGLPVPGHGLGEHRLREVLDVAEQGRQLRPVGRADRGQRQRAVAGQDRGDAVLGHRVAHRVPVQRRVEVGVRVDETGGDHRSGRVYDPLAVGPQGRADLGDDAAADPDVGGAGRRAGPVHERAAPYQDVAHLHPPIGAVSLTSTSRSGGTGTKITVP